MYCMLLRGFCDNTLVHKYQCIQVHSNKWYVEINLLIASDKGWSFSTQQEKVYYVQCTLGEQVEARPTIPPALGCMHMYM